MFSNLSLQRLVRQKPVKLIFVCLLAVASVHTASADNDPPPSISVYGPEMEGALGADGKGFYHDFWRLVVPNHEKFPVATVPLIRALEKFKFDSESCQYPAILVPEVMGEGIIFSKAFSRLIASLVSSDGTKFSSDYSDLKGKSIVLPGEYTGPVAFRDANLIVVSSLKQRVIMLMSGRVDYMVTSMPATQLLHHSMELPPFSYEPFHKIEEYNLHLKCNETPSTKKLIAAFNANLEAKLAVGDVERLFERYNLKYSIYQPMPEIRK